jgi:hypothetical protein
LGLLCGSTELGVQIGEVGARSGGQGGVELEVEEALLEQSDLVALASDVGAPSRFGGFFARPGAM